MRTTPRKSAIQENAELFWRYKKIEGMYGSGEVAGSVRHVTPDLSCEREEAGEGGQR